jgi:hypothetical protein
MAIVINGSGTVTGLAVGGLPDGTVDSDTLASNAVVTGKIADGTIANADINDLAASKLTGALPAISGANLTGITTGKVLQAVSGYTGSEVAITTTSYTDTGLSATITPSATSSRVLIIAHQSFAKTGYNTQIDADLLRGSTVIISQWLNDDVRTNDATSLALAPAALVWLDSPNTTSATTYKTQFRNAAGTGQVISNNNNGQSQIVLLEIAV